MEGAGKRRRGRRKNRRKIRRQEADERREERENRLQSCRTMVQVVCVVVSEEKKRLKGRTMMSERGGMHSTHNSSKTYKRNEQRTASNEKKSNVNDKNDSLPFAGSLSCLPADAVLVSMKWISGFTSSSPSSPSLFPGLAIACR